MNVRGLVALYILILINPSNFYTTMIKKSELLTWEEKYCCCCEHEFDQEKSIKNQTDYMKKLWCYKEYNLYKRVCWDCFPDVIR